MSRNTGTEYQSWKDRLLEDLRSPRLNREGASKLCDRWIGLHIEQEITEDQMLDALNLIRLVAEIKFGIR